MAELEANLETDYQLGEDFKDKVSLESESAGFRVEWVEMEWLGRCIIAE
jgi:hypothetical protein